MTGRRLGAEAQYRLHQGIPWPRSAYADQVRQGAKDLATVILSGDLCRWRYS